MLFRVVSALSRPIVALLFRPRVRGREHVLNGGVVVCPNHLSGWDTIAVAYALPGRRLRTMAKAELFVRPLLGPLVSALGAFPARSGDARSSVEAAAHLARAGETILIFPEGARHRSDRVHKPQTGAARVALAAGVPLVPVAIAGTYGKLRPRRWSVTFGAPVPLESLPADETAAAREATRRLWERVTALQAEQGAVATRQAPSFI
jgi:1-acyl-sn-glycerol-3-phosphate acyltransferase